MIEKPTLSYTQIEVFLRCSQKYFYKYGLGIRPLGKSPRMQSGSAVHSALEHWYIRPLEKRSSKALRKYYDDAYDKEKADILAAQITAAKEKDWDLNVEEYSKEMDKEYQRGLVALTEYYKHYGSDTDIPKITTELPGTVDFGFYYLTFKLDGIFERDGDIVLFETKTQATPDIEALEMYDIQTILYTVALERAGVQVDETLYNVIGMPPPTGSRSKKHTEFYRTSVYRTESEKEWVQKVADNAATAIISLKSGKSLPIPAFNKTCEWCEYKSLEMIMRAGGDVDTLLEEMYTTKTLIGSKKDSNEMPEEDIVA